MKYRSHPIYNVWDNMKQRCCNPKKGFYTDYGGRGICICDEWKNNSNIFIDWALDNGWEKGLYIDRINNDGNYTPENCRFVGAVINSNNTRLLRSTNTTGYRGVFKTSSRKNPYEASICINYKKCYLGSFPSATLAALRYDAEAYRLDDGRPMNFIDREV